MAACLESWRRAGLKIVAFNHPAEIPDLRRLYGSAARPDAAGVADIAGNDLGIEHVAVESTTEATFERPLVPIHEMVAWARRHGVVALLVNADIELDLAHTTSSGSGA